jgi:hypothetical protein
LGNFLRALPNTIKDPHYFSGSKVPPQALTLNFITMNASAFNLSKDGSWLVAQTGTVDTKTGIVTQDDPVFINAHSQLGLDILKFQESQS